MPSTVNAAAASSTRFTYKAASAGASPVASSEDPGDGVDQRLLELPRVVLRSGLSGRSRGLGEWYF
jgi:hypothetical protein